MYQIIPLTSDPNQKFQSTVQVDGNNITLNFTFSYNEVAGYWVMSVKDSTSTLLVDSLPLITGKYPASNILGQYAYLGIGSAYIIATTQTTLDYPDDSTLGTTFVLIWTDSEGYTTS